MAYETQCGGCSYYDFQGDNYKGYCSWYKSYYYPGETCSHQKSTSGGNCYITTIVCNILGFDDDCPVLANLRYFRDNIMQKDEKYKDILHEYDSIGPDLAYFVEREYKETNEDELWVNMYNFYLVPTANFVINKEYDAAVDRYKEMVSALKEYFGIPEDFKQRIPEDYDYQQGGHGKMKILTNNNEMCYNG